MLLSSVAYYNTTMKPFCIVVNGYTLLSNLIICYCRLTDYKTAIELGLKTLNDASSLSDNLALYKKITFNVSNALKTIMQQTKDATQYTVFQQIGVTLIEKHLPLLEDDMCTELRALCTSPDEAQNPASINTEVTNPHRLFHYETTPGPSSTNSTTTSPCNSSQGEEEQIELIIRGQAIQLRAVPSNF